MPRFVQKRNKWYFVDNIRLTVLFQSGTCSCKYQYQRY